MFTLKRGDHEDEPLTDDAIGIMGNKSFNVAALLSGSNDVNSNENYSIYSEVLGMDDFGYDNYWSGYFGKGRFTVSPNGGKISLEDDVHVTGSISLDGHISSSLTVKGTRLATPSFFTTSSAWNASSVVQEFKTTTTDGDVSANPFLKFTAANAVNLITTINSSILDLDTPTINTQTQATAFALIDNNSNALNIGGGILNIDTTDNAEKVTMSGDLEVANSGSFKRAVITSTTHANPATLQLKSTDGSTSTSDVFGKIDWTSRGDDNTVQEVIGRIHVEARSNTWQEGDKPSRMSFKVADNGSADLTEIFHIQFDDANPSMTVNEELKVAKAVSVGGITPSGTTGRIDASNDVVAFSSSDIRFKENVTPIQDALFKVQQLQGIEFDWKPLTKEEKKTLHDNEGHDVGVIAQEVEKVLPEVVQTRESGYKAVKYEKIVPLLIESIKELTKRVEELENGNN